MKVCLYSADPKYETGSSGDLSKTSDKLSNDWKYPFNTWNNKHLLYACIYKLFYWAKHWDKPSVPVFLCHCFFYIWVILFFCIFPNFNKHCNMYIRGLSQKFKDFVCNSFISCPKLKKYIVSKNNFVHACNSFKFAY